MKKLLGILVLGLFIVNMAEAEQSSWIGKQSKKHKIWAKDFHKGIKDKDRYENVIEAVIGKDIQFKPKKVPFPGINFKISMNSKIKNGGMAEINGAEHFAYSGNTFYSVTVDQSKCNRNTDGFSDCKQDSGSSRVELIAKGWTFTEGQEHWMNYAVLPANNILFNNPSRRFTVGQCHPHDSEAITWMVKFKDGRLVLTHNFKSWKNDNGEWMKGSEWTTDNLLKKFDNINEHNGSDEWTNIRIQFKNSKNPDGKLKVWINGGLKYDYEGPTNWNNYKGFKGYKSKCVVKFGLYTNANLKSATKETRENMVVFVDNMAFAKTEVELEKLLKEDK